MSACYSVTLSIKVKNEKGALNALQQKIANGHNEHTNYSLEKHSEEGLEPDTLENCIRIFLSEWRYCHQIVDVTIDDDGFTTYYNGFNASYGWEVTMIEMFECISEYLEDDSSLTIYPDYGKDEYIVKNGKTIEVKQ